MTKARILWLHTFTPERVSSGVFMHTVFDRLKSMEVDVTMHSLGSLRGLCKMLRGIWCARRLSKDYDLVHAQYGSGCGYASSFAACPKVLWLRGTDLVGMDVGGMRQRIHSVLNRWVTRRSLPAYDKVLVVSRRMEAGLRKLRPNANVEVLPDGVDLQRFRPMDRHEARRWLGEGEDRSPWVLFSSVSGSASFIKRVPLAMETMRLVQTRCPEAKLKVLTGQPHESVPYWVNASDMVLLTSTQEGWPNIIKEALACNVPFVSTDVSDLKAIADVEPSCKVVADDPEVLAEAVLTVLRAGRPENLRRRVEWMDLNAVARRLISLYEELCPSSRSGEH
jgi:glycosyltransferase involved in cell wall biosynthesis